MLEDGYSDVPDGKVAAVVTHLQMTARPAARTSHPDDVAIRHVRQPDVDWYRDLYFRVGSEWLWAFRLGQPKAELAARLQDARVEVHALERAGTAVGFAELDFRIDGACELSMFGLTAPEVGRGLGRHLMNHAIAQAWSKKAWSKKAWSKKAWSQPITRFWVHTCTLDHPGALQFYIRSGFTPFRRQIEVTDDPRLTGNLPITVAQQIPIIKPAA